jgi:hypothetical protein
MCLSSGEITISMGRLVFVTHPHRVTNTKCRIDTVISPDDGHSHPKHVEKRNKHTKKNCARIWLYLQDCTGVYGKQNIRLNTQYSVLDY